MDAGLRARTSIDAAIRSPESPFARGFRTTFAQPDPAGPTGSLAQEMEAMYEARLRQALERVVAVRGEGYAAGFAAGFDAASNEGAK